MVYRKPSERNANPDRLNLDKRDLTHMPLLEGEERLRLLNLQHNHVSKIENLVSLPALIFYLLASLSSCAVSIYIVNIECERELSAFIAVSPTLRPFNPAKSALSVSATDLTITVVKSLT
mgnify:CR=1 FL=1